MSNAPVPRTSGQILGAGFNVVAVGIATFSERILGVGAIRTAPVVVPSPRGDYVGVQGIESDETGAAVVTFVTPRRDPWWKVECRVGIVMAAVEGERAEVFATLTAPRSTGADDLVRQRPPSTGGGASSGYLWLEAPADTTVALTLLADTATCESFVAEARFLATPMPNPI